MNIDISEARKHFGSLPVLVKEHQIVTVMRHQRPAFALVDTEYLDTLLETLEIMSDPDAMEMLRQSIEDIKAGRVVSSKKLLRE